MTDEYTNPAALEKFHKNERDRHDAGRYNFDEAANFICTAIRGRGKSQKSIKLIQAAKIILEEMQPATS